MNWKIHFIKHAATGLIPKSFQGRLRALKRKVSPHHIAKHIIDWTIDNAIYQVEMLRKSGVSLKGKRYLELGPGWYPIVPVMFHLAGCSSIIIVDKQRLMDDETFTRTFDYLLECSYSIADRLDLDEEFVVQKLTLLKSGSLEEGLAEMNAIYSAPNDVLFNTISKGSIDIITSRAVLEHIDPEMVSKIFKEFHRMLHPRGSMCHIIDNGDHWQQDDPHISKLNFLKYSDKIYTFIAGVSPHQYMNRLRHPEYIELLNKNDFDVVLDESIPDVQVLEDLKTLRLNEKFSHFSHDELAIITSFLVAVPKESPKYTPPTQSLNIKKRA